MEVELSIDVLPVLLIELGVEHVALGLGNDEAELAAVSMEYFKRFQTGDFVVDLKEAAKDDEIPF